MGQAGGRDSPVLNASDTGLDAATVIVTLMNPVYVPPPGLTDGEIGSGVGAGVVVPATGVVDVVDVTHWPASTHTHAKFLCVQAHSVRILTR